jgi:Tol biopolymer transport system component
VVFQSSSGGEIMVINADGSGLRRLTNGLDPVLSPSGQQVAFTRWVGDTGSLWTIDIDGANERQILGEMRKAKGPEWSPDGAQIVLNFQHGGKIEENQVCRALDQNPRPPRNATRIRVVVNDKGEARLCWILPPDPHWSLRLINVADSSYQDLYGGLYAFRPTWDPSQPWRIVSDAGNGLLAVDVNRADYRQQVTDVVGDSSPVFSPDGRFIAVTTQLQNEYAIFRMNSDGGGRVRLTETPLWVPVQPGSEGKLWNNVAPTWSPDSAQIAFLTDRAGRWEIWLMNVDGSNQRPMFSEEINNQIEIQYDFVDERVLSWR